MRSTTEITVAQLARLVGLPTSPRLVDVRTEEDYAAAHASCPARVGAITPPFRRGRRSSGPSPPSSSAGGASAALLLFVLHRGILTTLAACSALALAAFALGTPSRVGE
jgi:hypothetical protein